MPFRSHRPQISLIECQRDLARKLGGAGGGGGFNSDLVLHSPLQERERERVNDYGLRLSVDGFCAKWVWGTRTTSNNEANFVFVWPRWDLTSLDLPWSLADWEVNLCE